MSPGGGRCPSRAGWIRRRHGVGAKIGADSAGIDLPNRPAVVGGGRSICVREHHRGRRRLRIDAEGNLYVLDSEDEDSDLEVAADGVRVAAEGARNCNQGGSYDLPMEGHSMVDAVADGPALVPAAKPEDMDMVPEVAARLKEVLANIDPIYHGVVVSNSVVPSNSSFTSGPPKLRSS